MDLLDVLIELQINACGKLPTLIEELLLPSTLMQITFSQEVKRAQSEFGPEPTENC
jgi:hypothetical protein